MSPSPYAEMHPSVRLLLGPGPANVHPRVLQAMSAPILGHLDPELLTIMDDIRAMLQLVFRTQNELTLALSGTGSAGMEACLLNVVEPGEKVIVGVGGYFGWRLTEVARRLGAEVIQLDYPWGDIADPERVIQTYRQHQDAKVLALVHAETSTGVCQPLEEIGQEISRGDTLFLVDCVTSLGGIPVEVDHWKIDLAYSCSQKCIGMPSGLSPVTVSEKARAAISKRKSPIPSWYVGFDVLSRYWSEERMYHHTISSTLLYGLREALRLIWEEGLENRWQRHQKYGTLLQERLTSLGFTLFAREGYRLPVLTTVALPARLNPTQARTRLLREHSIEIGAGLGEYKDKLWRIGLMGSNANRANVEYLCGVVTEMLRE